MTSGVNVIHWVPGTVRFRVQSTLPERALVIVAIESVASGAGQTITAQQVAICWRIQYLTVECQGVVRFSLDCAMAIGGISELRLTGVSQFAHDGVGVIHCHD